MENFPINEMLMNLGCTKKVYNRGIGGFTIDEYNEVLDVVLDLEPSKLFINIGSNDLSLPGDTLDNLLSKYKALILRIQAALPACQITMLAFYPCRDSNEPPPIAGRISRTMDMVNLANEQLQLLATELGCGWLNCNAPLLADDGMLRQDYMTDPVHFSPAGYAEVLKILREHL
ncbi:MAG: GDSL-type esterase/lipase family protein [Saccharofermentanales bacterium]